MTSGVDYNRVAEAYDRRYEVASFRGMEQALLDLVAGCPGGRVLEVGCGTGHWLGFLAGHGLAVAGLDSSAGMLRLARSCVPTAVLAEGSAESLPWQRGRFHRVICINAIHHFRDQQRFLAEANEVLLAGGGLLVIGLDPHTGVDKWCVYEYFSRALENDRKRYPSTRQVEEMMCAGGFHEVRTTEVHRTCLELPARAAVESRLLDKSTVSQLALLSDAEYDEGMKKILDDLAEREGRGLPLSLVVDLRFYGTVGWKPGEERRGTTSAVCQVCQP